MAAESTLVETIATPDGTAHSGARRGTLWELTSYFLKLGTIGFGGPVALVGYMQRDLVERHQWIDDEEYKLGLALAQIMPGPLAAQGVRTGTQAAGRTTGGGRLRRPPGGPLASQRERRERPPLR